MKSLILLGAALTVSLGTSASAQSCSDGAIAVQQVGLDRYEPTAQATSTAQVALRLLEDCEPQNVTFVPRNTQRFVVMGPGGELAAQRIASPEVQLVNSDTARLSAEAIARLSAGQSLTIELLEFQVGQFLAPGDYALELDVELDGVSVASLPVVITVEPAVQLLGEAATGMLDVDLGEVRNGAGANRTIYLRSNVRMRVEVKSEFGGRLRHELGDAYGTIPYDLTINDVQITSAMGMVPLVNATGQLQAADMSVAIPAAPPAFSGSYRDIVTLSFVPD